jgi:uncharacterized protein involved in exopolysaccharide biosynthesis
MKEKDIHLFDYVLVLHRRRWVLFSTFILVVVSVAIGVYKKPEPVSIYQAAATLIVKPDRPALVNIQGGQPFYQQYFDEGVDRRTQLQILSSRVILERIADELDLSRYGVEPSDEARVIEKVRNSVRVVPVSGTHLVRIIAKDDTPEKAIQLANTMAEVYIEYNLQTKLSSARKTLVWLNEQIIDLRSKVQEAYTALSEYQNQNQILSLEMSPEIQAAKLAELNNTYEKAKQERVEAETRLNELQKMRKMGTNFEERLAISFNDTVLGKLREELTAAEIERTNLLQSYKEKHPKVKQADLTIQTLRQNLTTTIDTLFKKFEADVSVFRAREVTLAESLSAFKKEALEINTKRLEYSKLKSEVASTEELYNLLFRQLKETTITGDLERNNIRILESARTATNITEPLKREQIIISGVIIAVLLGIGLAFLFEYFDKTVKTPEDVEQYLGLPVLGTIPKIDKQQSKAYTKSVTAKKKHYVLEGRK